MKKSAIIKIITVLTLIFILINYMSTVSNAMSMIGDAIEDGKGFLSTPTDPTIKNSVDGKKIVETSRSVFNIVFSLAVIVAVGVIFVLGIQFIVGSIEQKAKIKEMLIPYCVGCIVIFGAIGIWKLVISIASVI